MKNHLTTRIKEITDKVSIRSLLIVVIGVFCLMEVVLLVGNVHQILLEDRHAFNIRDERLMHKPEHIATPDEVQPWMTFSYINFIFKIPDSYLQSRLGITDSKYPRIQIQKYARAHSLDVGVLLGTIKQLLVDLPK